MNISRVSSFTLDQSMKNLVRQKQADLIPAREEATNGYASDAAAHIRNRYDKYVTMKGELNRLESFKGSISLAEGRLDTTQKALKDFRTVSKDLMGSVIGADDFLGKRHQAEGVVETLTSIVNRSWNGEHVFAGVNTDVEPLKKFAGSDLQKSIDDAFETKFGFPKNDAQAKQITGEKFREFLGEVATDLFGGAGWNDHSSAADKTVTTRILPGQSVGTSVSGNEKTFRDGLVGAISVAMFADSPLGSGAKQALSEFAAEKLASAIGGATELESEVGSTQARLGRASEQISAQSNLLTDVSKSMVAIDPFEAATRMNTLLTQLESSYILTRRLQEMSILKQL